MINLYYHDVYETLFNRCSEHICPQPINDELKKHEADELTDTLDNAVIAFCNSLGEYFYRCDIIPCGGHDKGRITIYLKLPVGSVTPRNFIATLREAAMNAIINRALTNLNPHDGKAEDYRQAWHLAVAGAQVLLLSAELRVMIDPKLVSSKMIA